VGSQPSGHRRAMNLLLSREDLNGSDGQSSRDVRPGFRPPKVLTYSRAPPSGGAPGSEEETSD